MLYPNVWPLPYGVTIRTDYSPEHNYLITKSQTQCWKVELEEYQQVYITAVWNGLVGNQTGTIRCWMSQSPNGPDILPVVFGNQLNVRLSTLGRSWSFYEQNIDSNLIVKADIMYPIYAKQIYYFNVKNLENKNNSYYLRFTFIKDGNKIDL